MVPYRKRLILGVCLLILTGAMFSSICFQKTGHIYPNAAAFGEFSQLSEEQLSDMSTRALVQAVLHDPYMTQFTAYNCGQDAMLMNMQEYAAYRELCGRDDYYESLARLYDKASTTLSGEESGTADEQYRTRQDIANLEILLAHDIYEYGCSAQPMDSRKAWDELVRTANACIRAEREKNPNAYDMDGFYWYYSMNPEATDALHADNGAVAVLLQELAGEV